MGIYKITSFAKNILLLGNQTKLSACKNYVVQLSSLNSMLDRADIARGYVKKEDLLRVAPDLIKPEDIGEHSFMVDYTWTTYDSDDMDGYESRRLPVK